MSMKEFISGFSGKPLDKKQIAKGMHLCYMNARALRDEAILLKQNNHHARALSLIILGLEELGKIPMFCNMILLRADEVEAWRKPWKELQSHKVKLGVWTTYGKRVLSVLGKGYEVELPSGIEPLVDKFKQLGFYVTFFKGQFLYPENVAEDNHDWFEYFQGILDERIKSFEPLHGSLEKSTELTDKAEKFVTTMKKAKTKDELKEMISHWISQYASNGTANTKAV